MVKIRLECTMWRAKRIAGVPISKDSFRSISQAVKDLSKRDYADDDEILHRIRICRKCPHYGTRCTACGCHLNTKLKLKNSTCPLHKWKLTTSDSGVDSSEHQSTSKESDEIVGQGA
jgi:hypothetical protein